MATQITSADDFDNTILSAQEEGKTVIAKFGASWCAPCDKIAPHFKKFAKEFEDLVFLDVDWDGDDIEDTGSEWNVKKLPTFVVIKDGKALDLLQHSDHEKVRNLIAPHSKSGKVAEDKENVLSDIKHQSNIQNAATDKQMDKQMDKENELKGLKDLLVKVAPDCKSEEVSEAVVAVELKQKYPASMDLDEPLCIESKNRFVLFPIANQEIWSMYKKHVASFWTAEEIDLHDDHKDWASLNAKEQHFIKYVLAFFAASDGIVLENLTSHFINDVKLPEARCFYAFQAAMENIHAETYSLLIDTYMNKQADKDELLGAMEHIKCVRDKADWALQWMARETAFCQRLVAFACVEGIFFSGSFCALFWLKKRGLMPGLTFSNELISRDEGLHTDFACLLYKLCKDKLDDETMTEIVRSAVDCEKEFICDSLPCDLIGMNSKLMGQYIEFVADRLLHALGHDKLYNTANPFDWMEMISLQGKTNFFERRVGEYAKAGVMGSLDKEAGGDMFTLDADF